MQDPKKFFKALVDYTTGKGVQPGGFAKVVYDKLSQPKDGKLSTKNREAFIREIAEDLIALNKVDPAVMRRSKWTPFYELEIKNMNPKQTQKAIDEGRIPSTTNLNAGNDLFKTLNPSVDQVVDYLMGIRPDVLKRKIPKFLGEVIVKNEFNEIIENPKQPVYDTKGNKTDNTIDLSESITEEEVVRGAPQVREKIARPKGVKFSLTTKKDLSWKTDEAGNMTTSFKVNNKKYNIELYPVDDEGDYRLNFNLETKNGTTKEITATGNSFKVFSIVYNGVVEEIQSNTKIKSFQFEADKSEPTRVKLYTTLMNKLADRLGWESDIYETTVWDGSGSFDFELVKPKGVVKGVKFSKTPNKAQQRKIDKQKKLYDADTGNQVLAENKNFEEIPEQYGIKSIDVKEGNQKGKDEVKTRIFEGIKEVNKDGEEVLVVAPFMTLIPESALTPGTLSNGGLNENLSSTEGYLELKVIKKMKTSGLFEKVNAKTPVREYTLIDGSKIRNDNPDFISEEIQLKIAPVGKFLFANKLQIDNAIAKAKAKGYEFAPENSKIEMAVKRQGYTARLLKEMKEPDFFEKQTEKRDGLKELMLVFDEAVQFNKVDYLPVVTAILSATSGSQNHLGRTGSIVEFYNTLDLRNVEEHTEPASDLMKFFLNRMAQGNLNEYIDAALDSFFQGALPEVYDNMLKGTSKDGEKFNYIKNIPAEYISDVLLGLKSVWIRYFNPNVNSQIRIDEKGNKHRGIDPNVIILSNGKSIAENFGLYVDNKFLNPEVIALQQQLLFEILNGDITQKVAKQRLKKSFAYRSF